MNEEGSGLNSQAGAVTAVLSEERQARVSAELAVSTLL